MAQARYLGDEVLLRIAGKHGKTPAQILIRWSLQKGFVPLPKSAQPQRVRENAEVFDFELDEDDVIAMDALERGKAGATYRWNSA